MRNFFHLPHRISIYNGQWQRNRIAANGCQPINTQSLILLLLTPHMQNVHEQYMYRCLQLARLGQGKVAPNPMVGAVLVHGHRIIGEGWHKQWGGPHAEVVCIASVAEGDRHLVPEATIYVSLEPCAHWGKTPPCSDLILEHRIRQVVVGCRDPFPLVAGKGIEKLQAAGVEVKVGVLEGACMELNKRFFHFHTVHRPYIILKWAQTGDFKISAGGGRRLKISGAATDRLVHRWRSEEAAIMVGTNTALADNPELTTRLWPGSNPLRLVVDLNDRLPQSLQLFSGYPSTLVFSRHRHNVEGAGPLRQQRGTFFYQVADDASLVHQVVHALYQLGVQSVLVEGGAQLLQAFIDAGLWDEARIITNDAVRVGEGLPAPVLQHAQFMSMLQLGSDTIRFYANEGSNNHSMAPK